MARSAGERARPALRSRAWAGATTMVSHRVTRATGGTRVARVSMIRSGRFKPFRVPTTSKGRAVPSTATAETRSARA